MGLITLIGCRSDILTINSDSKSSETTTISSNKQNRFSTSFVSETGVEKILKNNNIKSKLKESISKVKLNNLGKDINEKYSIFEKTYDSLKKISTYSLNLIEYSDKNPYYLKSIITVKDDVEKFGFLKIIPDSKPEIEKEILINFSGTIQILDSEMTVRSQTKFLNGVPQNINNKSSNSTTGKQICTESFLIVEHLCTGDAHHVGESCNMSGGERAYYEWVSTGVECYGGSGEEDLYISVPSEPTIGSGGGGGATSISKVLNNPKFNYSSFLFGANKMDLLNFVANYVYVNDPASTGYYNEVSDTVITQLNQIISIFANINLFSDFDNLQNLLNNQRFYLQGEGVHYDLRIYNLIKYLFEHPTQENADFVSWATQFFIDNTSQNGICSVSSIEFEDWFLNPSLSDNLINELRTDWENPNIVKPTARFKNNAILNCIYNKAKSSANFQQYLKNFDGRFSVAHLQFDLKSLAGSINAQTSPPNGFWIKIDINSNNLNRPSLDIARTLMHEIIHAEMYRILLSLAPTSNGQINVSELTTMLTTHNYPGIYDYFRRFGLNNMQHEQMAQHYRDIIKNYLKQIDSSITDSEAESMAWVGLQNTVAWTNLGSVEQNNILNTYNNWKDNATHNCP